MTDENVDQNTKQLDKVVKRISMAPGGATIYGYNTISINKKYFAYSSHFSVFLYDISTFQFSESICQGDCRISNIILSKTNPDEIAILFSNGLLTIYNMLERTQKLNVNIPCKKNYHYLSMEFNPDGTELLIFIKDIYTFIDVNLQQGKYKELVIPSIETVSVYRQHPDLANISILATEGSRIYVYNTEKIVSKSASFSNHIYHITFDPLNTMNCLMISKSPTWVVFSFLPDFNLISQSGNSSIKAKSGDWIPALPGHIVTGSSEHGILHVWTISNSQIVDTIQLENAPVVSVSSINDKSVIVTFNNGLFGVVDITKRSYLYKINNAHRNTIFSCNILPTDPSILATGGADGQICLWSLPILERKNSFTICNAGSLMTTCFSPGGGYLAAGSLNGTVMIFSTKTFEKLISEQLHKSICLSIAWSPHDPEIICTAGEDNQCQIYNIKDKKIVTTISVKSKFRKVQWSRKEKTIAIACFDGSIYVRMEGGAYQVIKGSASAPLFDVAWSPFHPTWIASTDDEGGVLIFDTESQTCKRAVEHKDKARPVLWSESIDYLLISGSWDGNIILWDARTLTKLGLIKAHSSHVYGLATHPAHPYMFVSTSRDETIRVWSFDRMFPEEKIHSLLKEEKFDAVKFCPFEGSEDLIKLLHRIMHDGTRQSFNDGDLCHINDIIRLTRKRVTRMTSALPHEQSTLMRSKKARTSAIAAADLCLKSGDIKRYCELMFIAGEFNMALSAAPAVGYNFWQNLMMARAQMLKGTEEGAELTLVAGKPIDAIDQFLDINSYDNALLITAALRETNFVPRTKSISLKNKNLRAKQHENANAIAPSASSSSSAPADSSISGSQSQPQVAPPTSEHLPFIRTNFESASDYGPYIVASSRSLQFAKEGKPLLSAAALLTVGDVTGAAWRLLHCGELMWAVEVARCMETVDDQIYDVLARYCIVNGCASEIFPDLSPKLRRKLAPLVPLATDSERDEFYKKFQMKSTMDYYEEAKRSRGIAKVQFLLLCGRQNEAAMLAVQLLRSLISQGPFNYSDAMNIIQLIRNIYVPEDDRKEPIWNEVVALCFYFGVYEAMWRGYDSIIEKLVVSTEQIINKFNFEYLKPKIKEMKCAAALSLAQYKASVGKAYINENNFESEIYDGIKALNDNVSVDGGSTVKSLGTGKLPIHLSSDPIVSVCSGLKIDGNIFYLEDGQSAMSAEEALMWFEVNPFSPLETHERLFPF
ncbi:hypothetical protein M9Y10_006614 [Tritrichomonas musculus]|uniref:WD repeat protein n=1 Tax=Tritrichomonas musculus TaxID=1915356 RepID=A0ABR2JFS0_9EUKA